MYMQLTREEHKRHRGTMDLKVVAKPREYPQRVADEHDGSLVGLPAGVGLYQLQTGCANLTDDFRCSIYAERPRCCREFELGSLACLKARRKAGLDADKPPLPDIVDTDDVAVLS